MIHVICSDISGVSTPDYQMLYAKASDERKDRADRYRRREDAIRCVTADALLRYALGTSSYTVGKTSSGKPFIRGKDNFHYNLSHAGNWVVLAFGDSDVGVDVEQFRADTDIEAVASRFFSPEEQRYVRKDPEKSREHFFEIWTAKESYLKYLGTGLKKDMRAFSVLSPDLNVNFHHRTLPDSSLLSLCTTENDYFFELLDLPRLL
ncbi:MAG: 4'-phosphopantetheinyl transferase superfamily protein [Oscillibacter sp.]|nr:4'-phosphopantetheinyl transferase superfamily protein [Oscillibacter sp.]